MNFSTEGTFPIKIDYSKSLDEMISVGHYKGHIPEMIKGYPLSGEGVHEKKLILVRIDGEMYIDSVRIVFMQRGLRAAYLEELLALGEQHPDLQRRFPIMALGSVWDCPHTGASMVPSLYRHGPEGNEERTLNEVTDAGGFRGMGRYAAVAKD